jgi:hypothetical protein
MLPSAKSNGYELQKSRDNLEQIVTERNPRAHFGINRA